MVAAVAITVRDAQLGDRELLRRLLGDYLLEFDGETEPYPHFEAYWSETERLPFLLEDAGEVVGFCLIRVRSGGWSIAEVTVVPEQRRRGIGRAAVERLAERARAAGAGHLEAKVHPENRRALPFWLAVGFSVVEAPSAVVTRRERSRVRPGGDGSD
jgi:ribosomal protein S18 acetylase RimI-like enzyme